MSPRVMLYHVQRILYHMRALGISFASMGPEWLDEDRRLLAFSDYLRRTLVTRLEKLVADDDIRLQEGAE